MDVDKFLSQYESKTQLSLIQQVIEDSVTRGVGYRDGEHLGSRKEGVEGSDRDIELHAHLGDLDLRTKRGLSPIERIALSMNVEAFKMANFTITHPEILDMRKEEDRKVGFTVSFNPKYKQCSPTDSSILGIGDHNDLSNLIKKYPNSILGNPDLGCNKTLPNIIPPKSNQNSILPTYSGFPSKYN